MPDTRAMQILTDSLAQKGLDVRSMIDALKHQTIETPSWGYSDSGTRFKVFNQRGAARNVFERIQDAACVHKLTAVSPSVAVHVLWDFADAEVGDVVEFAASLGMKIGAVNPTLFEQDEYKFGSLGNPDREVQKKALDHIFESIEIMKSARSQYLSLWFPDGTNYPGQDNLVSRKGRMSANLKKVHDALPDRTEMLLEYKFFEPSFYSTDIPDWGTAYILARKCGPKAKVLVDLGHHSHGTNIEQIVGFLIDEDMLGGFHFNSRKYADDDLTTGSMDPYELFLIFNELLSAEDEPQLYDAPYMIDQSHNVKLKIEAMIQSVMSIQEACAKAMCVDRPALREAQNSCDIVAAEQILKDAFNTDVRPLLQVIREEMDLDPNPLRAFRQSKYQDMIESERS